MVVNEKGNGMERLLIYNHKSGQSDNEAPVDHFPGFRAIPIDRGVGEVTAARDDATLELVAVWGGDGTMRSVAAVLAGSDIALLPCPGGTHNHFALDLGIVDLDAVDAALADGKRLRVDVGMAGDQLFLNNANAGWYVDLVARRERLERRIPRMLAKALSVAFQLGRTRRLHVELDGEASKVWMIWIGNGQFSLEPSRLAERDDPADGVLDVRLLRADGRLPKLHAFASMVALAIRGQDPATSPDLERLLVQRCTFHFRRESVRFALDGELVRLRAPVPFSCRRRALTVLIPPTPIGLTDDEAG